MEKLKKIGNRDDNYHLKLFGKIDNIDHEFGKFLKSGLERPRPGNSIYLNITSKQNKI